MRPLTFIGVRQRNWARRHGIPFDDDGYVITLNDNLFLPLSSAAIQDFQQGAGGELRENMFALHSSSAFVANVFDYWRHLGEFNPILQVLKPGTGDAVVRDVQFEAPLPINWPDQMRARSPHLDLLIKYQAGAAATRPEILAVESKLREPYSQNQGGFLPRYLDPVNLPMWAGLDPLHQLAQAIHQGQRLYRRLKVSQLIKHILGLRSQFPGHHCELLYLWYAVPGTESIQHASEIRQFAELTAASGVTFRAMTYQQVIHDLASQHRGTHRLYVDYLMERYF